jgi:hypothetical protein
VRYVRSFARFWSDFVVGDDWRVAAGLAAGLGLTWLLAHRGLSAWWLLPVTVAVVLAESVWRESQALRDHPVATPTRTSGSAEDDLSE